LQAEANAQEWDAALNGVEQWSTELVIVESADQRGEVTNARKDEGFGVGDFGGGVGALGLSAEAMERAFDGSDVACAIVNKRNFHKRPFVLGRTLRKRLSCETANRSARAKALKIASTW